MMTKEKLKQDIARLILHPRFCGLRAYCGGDWECDIQATKTAVNETTISGNPLGVCVAEALKALRAGS